MLVVFAAAAGVAVSPVHAADGACFKDWSDAGPVVRQEGLTPAKQLPELARDRVEGDLIKVTLCEEGGRYVYRLVFFDASGRVTNLTVDAKDPFPN